MGPPENRNVSQTHSLFVDDWKVYQENHEILGYVNEVIIQVSHDAGACYGLLKCAEMVFKRGKMLRGEGLEVLEELKWWTLKKRRWDQNQKKVKILTNIELNDVNLVRAISTKVIPVAAYPMNVCKFIGGELKKLDQVKKTWIKIEKHARKAIKHDRLYLRREEGERGMKSLKDICKETRLTVTCCMVTSKKQVDRLCMEKRKHQGGEFNSRRSNQDNGGRRSRDPIWGR